MAKYSTEFKMKVVKEYLETNISYKNLTYKYSIPNKSIIITRVNAYKTQGYEGLKVKRKNTQYTLEFKLNVVNLYLRGEMSYQSLANELKINNPSIIVRWVNAFREKDIEGLKPKKEEVFKNAKVRKNLKDTKVERNSLTQAQLKKR
ncbi:transposase [Gemella sp. zg-570]|uniref:helix-turn-helix domain-containing protein n=1 Tax=Gemella sp. zg-570 TaxID=2840371 RepID=UPI001C0D547A|nr:transposase [Gemella sp. zg-570]QWQ39190.1 transposase [Gemella sp. zg-570]